MNRTPSTEPPLADYFWIAGIDSISYGEHLAQDSKPTRRSFAEQLLEEEDVQETLLQAPAGVSGVGSPALSGGLPSPPGGKDPRIFPTAPAPDAQGGSIEVAGNEGGGLSSRTATPSNLMRNGSNSSNSTITNTNTGSQERVAAFKGMTDQDFDNALLKFAAERDSFLDELSFSAGTVVPNKPVMHPRAQRVVSEDISLQKTGSLRRRISLRDLTSMRRAPSVVNRASSIRTVRRMSNYNSVIPTPQPLNSSPKMHPLKRKFEPVLLDRYPPKHLTEEAKRRGPFPDYVPMFAFPNDVNIVSADERPRSTWHGFTMTGADNARLHGICVTMWIPLNPKAAEDLERRFKREKLDEEIVATEEKIGLMADLLRPVRHGAASKIEGLTDGETGLWIPRAYGILGKDASLVNFWKEWLKAVIVPMASGAIQRVPLSSPKVGIWQPLERYVVNLCSESPAPDLSRTQVEVAVRELRMYARKEAENELPGSRNTDLYALFRSLSLPNVVTMFEFALAESRIILLSSHTSLLHIVSRALISLMYPLQWLGIYIPVLPARLLSALEAPCPYIVGIERRYEKLELPEEDFVCIDLDSDVIISSTPPVLLPRQQRRKLLSLLQLAAPHHNRYGVPVGPPQYAIEAFPHNMFMSENAGIYTPNPRPSTLAKLVNLNSTSFGDSAVSDFAPRPLIFNAFLQSRVENPTRTDRPGTSGTMRGTSPPSPHSPNSAVNPPQAGNSAGRMDTGFTLTATLRGKRSGNFDAASRRSSSFGFERTPTLRRPSLPFAHHSPSPSTSSLGTGDNHSIFNAYPPSVFAPSTLAASTIMPSMLMQPVRNTDTTKWVEGHCLQWKPADVESVCSICDEKSDEGIYKCSSCRVSAHARCSSQIGLPCPVAFHSDQVRAAFVRCFASLFYTYRKFLGPAIGDGKKAGNIYKFNMEGFLKSMPQENSMFIQMLEQTQAFSEFIHDRESKKASDPSIKLFDEVILSKKNRGKSRFFSKSSINYLQDTSEHTWQTTGAISIGSSSRHRSEATVAINRTPAKLDPTLMKEPPKRPKQPKKVPVIVHGAGQRKDSRTTPILQINGK
ncbi:DENN-domain-containing protein [Tuber magnatum]|uniref:DENN-domain-containing protein n=1 Tax=Tuber magnatum TaxID=42249 RepID=A0A317SLJ1_9PEZI|nr:DENN-domain-containing protein [Tuber magnatum]